MTYSNITYQVLYSEHKPDFSNATVAKLAWNKNGRTLPNYFFLGVDKQKGWYTIITTDNLPERPSIHSCVKQINSEELSHLELAVIITLDGQVRSRPEIKPTNKPIKIFSGN